METSPIYAPCSGPESTVRSCEKLNRTSTEIFRTQNGELFIDFHVKRWFRSFVLLNEEIPEVTAVIFLFFPVQAELILTQTQAVVSLSVCLRRDTQVKFRSCSCGKQILNVTVE